MSPLDLVAVAVLAVKAAPGVWLAYSLCSRVLSTHVLLGEGALALLEAQMSVIQKLKALKRCQARAASVKGCYYSLLVNKQSALGKQYHWPEPTNSDCPGLLLQLGAGKNGISYAACSVTAGVQLGAFLITASSAYECLDFVSVRFVPQKKLELSCQEGLEGVDSTCQTGCWGLPAHTSAVNSEGRGGRSVCL